MGLTIAYELVKSHNIPLVFAIHNESEIITNAEYQAELKTLVSSYGCEIAQHGTDTMTGWSKQAIDEYFNNQITNFNNIGINIKNFVAPKNESDENLRIVGSKYFNLMCSTPNEINNRRSNRYKLGRYAITPGFGLEMYKSKIQDSIENKKLLILYFHSVTMANNEEYLQLVNEVINYAKISGISIDTLQSFFGK